VRIIVRIPSVEVAMKISVINISFRHWINSGMSTVCGAVIAERLLMKENVSFAREIFSVRLIFFGEL